MKVFHEDLIFETVKAKVITSLCDTVTLSVLISQIISLFDTMRL